MALRRISLKDFVIVAELDLALDQGFTALTGETGAGKSILIDALQLCLGARADATTVREGAQRADIWAEFDPPPAGSPVEEWLDQGGFDTQDTLLLRRSIDQDGKSRGWINGSPATASQLRQLGEQLVDIHGQHAWAALTRGGAVRELLDTFAGIQTQALAEAYAQWRQAQTKLRDAEHSHQQQQNEREHLLWQLTEIRRLAPKEGEWAEINLQHSRLANAQALMDASQLALALLDQDDTGAVAALAKSQHALAAVQATEPAFGPIADELTASLAQAQDAVYSLQAYLRRADLDPQRLAELDERMGQWMTLSRRFKTPPEALPALLSQWEYALAALDAASDLETLARQAQSQLAVYSQLAKQVSQARQSAAPQLGQAVTAAMQTLGMPGGQLVVELETRDQPAASGNEEVQFLVAGHTGTSPKPITKVASGGELSRIALALTVVAQQSGAAPTLIFDEVDAGVGGTVAQAVGRLMRELGHNHQVLAVTHLPQVAAYAHHHLRVSKQSLGDQTLSRVDTLGNDQRELEIARMLAGDPITPTSQAHAREMLVLGAANKAKP
jgi:DNA repair protein RecN (Recombination protein N)